MTPTDTATAIPIADDSTARGTSPHTQKHRAAPGMASRRYRRKRTHSPAGPPLSLNDLLKAADDDPAWRARAECRDAPALFFPSDSLSAAEAADAETEAKTACGRCPVEAICLADALARKPIPSHGIFGGMNPRERAWVRSASDEQIAELHEMAAALTAEELAALSGIEGPRPANRPAPSGNATRRPPSTTRRVAMLEALADGKPRPRPELIKRIAAGIAPEVADYWATHRKQSTSRAINWLIAQELDYLTRRLKAVDRIKVDGVEILRPHFEGVEAINELLELARRNPPSRLAA